MIRRYALSIKATLGRHPNLLYISLKKKKQGKTSLWDSGEKEREAKGNSGSGEKDRLRGRKAE